jgi:hypothetical protein
LQLLNVRTFLGVFTGVNTIKTYSKPEKCAVLREPMRFLGLCCSKSIEGTRELNQVEIRNISGQLSMPESAPTGQYDASSLSLLISLAGAGILVCLVMCTIILRKIRIQGSITLSETTVMDADRVRLAVS